mmetsp:Transcript_3065/g.8102  ORF Transcript_3065/g.8102 Transcript_3065/m.8102 type:complete len:205 (-) Transcript_3065:860-1474(-)
MPSASSEATLLLNAETVGSPSSSLRSGSSCNSSELLLRRLELRDAVEGVSRSKKSLGRSVSSAQELGGLHRYVSSMPRPLQNTPPVGSSSSFFPGGSSLCVASVTCTWSGLQVCSARAAVLMVPPKTVHLGSLVPISPDTHGPVWIPMRMLTGLELWGISTRRDTRSMSCAKASTRCAPRSGLWDSSTALKPSSSGVRIPEATR